LSAHPGQIAWSRIIASVERKSVRVAFDLDPGSEVYSELRLVLEISGQPASETWLYRWTA
jgi:glucans biosynthesis protein